MAQAVQTKLAVATIFMMQPIMSVWLTVTISRTQTMMVIISAEIGPNMKPPMQSTTSLKSKSRNPLTLGINLLSHMTTNARAVSIASVASFLVSIFF